MSEQTRIIYARDVDHNPVLTIVTDGENFGVSQCSKKDCFNKERGRTIAKARMLKAIEGADYTDVDLEPKKKLRTHGRIGEIGMIKISSKAKIPRAGMLADIMTLSRGVEVIPYVKKEEADEGK